MTSTELTDILPLDINVVEADDKLIITLPLAGITETKTVDQAKFFKALAIAVHNDGMPDYNVDYPDAESVMGDIRWIP